VTITTAEMAPHVKQALIIIAAFVRPDSLDQNVNVGILLNSLTTKITKHLLVSNS
jgi:hypothetical protein